MSPREREVLCGQGGSGKAFLLEHCLGRGLGTVGTSCKDVVCDMFLAGVRGGRFDF